MTTPPLRNDPGKTPLDSDERALAQTLRRLPASDPGPALDARVLGMAREALQPKQATPPQRRRLHRLSWLGTAAGAVLAVGVGWQLSQTEPGSASALRPAPAEAPQMHGAEAEGSLDIEVIRRPAAPASPAPLPAESADDAKAADAAPAAAERRRRSLDKQNLSERSSLAESQAPPPVPPPSSPTPQAEPLARPSRQEAPAGAAPAATDAGGVASEPRGDSLERIEVTGSRIGDAGSLDAEGFPPVAQDARLKPEDWVNRIRERRAAGQLEKSRRSLQDFVRSYPYLVVPEDLRPLLNQTP